jgi:hypothetical protein
MTTRHNTKMKHDADLDSEEADSHSREVQVNEVAAPEDTGEEGSG